MKNCAQTLILAAGTPDDLQDELNARLIPLGNNVRDITIHSTKKQFLACVTYEHEDLSTTMNNKLEALEPGADPDEVAFICVMNDSERGLASRLIRKMAATLEAYSESDEIVDEAQRIEYKDLAEKANKLLSRFETD